MRQLLAIALLACAATAQADSEECQRHELTTYPFSHRPSAEQVKALQGCDADKLYYGIGVHFDYVKARHCAFANEKQDVLMMLYANGLGVPRNYTVAKMAACRSDANEVEARLARLARMQSGKEGMSPKMDMCDDAGNSQLVARCAAIQLDLAEQDLDARIDTLSARWRDAEKLALQQLRRFGRREEILGALLEFEAGRLPSFSAEDALRAERELTGVADWAGYRDAWLALGRVRYPAVPGHAWRAYFARKRLNR